MKIDRWQRLERLFHEACDLPPAERQAFLERSCGDDAGLRSEVMRMLELDRRHDIIDTPVLARHRLRGAPEAAERLDPPTGTMIGPYRLVERVASGGMGVIYRAVRTDELLDFEVAVKLVRRGIESETLVQRFKDERHALAHLAHANIAHLLDGGTTEDGRPYLVMEYIHGRPIDRYCDERRLSIEQRLELFCVVCRAVHFAHQNLVIHCDLKPGNILVTDDGTPRIVDFGVARVLDHDRRAGGGDRASTPDPLGTPDYASPEQIAGRPVTTAADVYALGVVLFDLLTGRLPRRTNGCEPAVHHDRAPELPSEAVRAEEDWPSPARLAADRATTPQRLRRRLRGDLDSIVLTALQREPSRRYPSAEQLARDLERYLSGRPVTVRSDKALYRLKKFLVRHRTGVPLALIAVLALSASVVTTAAMVIRAGRQREAARLAETLIQDHEEHARIEAESIQAFVDSLTVSLLRPEEAGARFEQEAERVRRRFHAEPQLQADLLDWMGRILAGFGVYDQSEELALEALDIRRQAFGRRSLEVAASRRSLGWIASARGDHETAVDRFRDALAIHRNTPDDAHANVPGALADLAGALAAAGALDDAAELYRQAVAVGDDASPYLDLRIADALAELATRLEARGRLEEARESRSRALAIRRRVLGEDDPLVIETRRGLEMP